MRYAYNEKRNRIEATTSGETATCYDCDSIVIGKCGRIKINHWSHKSKRNCDNWYEPITEWHLQWQNLFPENNREVTIKKDNIIHRSDIRLNNGLVIEVQNSPINIDDIAARESFYGENNMIWILNGKNLTKHSSIEYKYYKKEFSISFNIYKNIQNFKKYEMDNFQQTVTQSKLIKEMRNDKTLIEFDIKNGYYFSFKYKTDKDFESLKFKINSLLNESFRDLNIDIYEFHEKYTKAFPKDNFDFDIKFIRIKKDYFTFINFEKKYWSQFIDYMTYPVFIDNLNGLGDNFLYWYQENKIVKKSNFVSKYLKYT